jgi:hypothetical protein
VGGFQPGHKRGGRPPRIIEESYLRAATRACPLYRWKKILAKAVDAAELGDAKARRWLSEILIGKDPVLLRHLAERVEQALEEISREPGSNGVAEDEGVGAQ